MVDPSRSPEHEPDTTRGWARVLGIVVLVVVALVVVMVLAGGGHSAGG